ncbi:MAG TPA: MBL fold metallo-hydrolase [Candidatus Aenigmarchaeota archaeon]|nr:MBL fold metallo-hydrolase [Candidatus Aenigmarchaeota archaeon]
MTSITFYGGVNDVGGNKILVKSKETSVFLDFGKSFSLHKKFYSEFNSPRRFKDYLIMGLIPKLKGLYRIDLLKDANYEVHEEPLFDAVFISHSHIDHCGYVPFIDSKIPIVCSKKTKKSMEAYEEITQSSLERGIAEYVELYDAEEQIWPDIPYPKPTKKNPDRKPTHKITVIKKRIEPPPIKRKFLTGNRVTIGDIEIELYKVDHSVIDAHACLVYTRDSTIAYTGDLRFHGPLAEHSFEFVEKAKREGVDVLITEGVRVNEETTLTEVDVEEKSVKLLKGFKKLVFVDFSYRDLYRLKTFKKVARRVGRVLVTSKKYASYWKLLRDLDPSILDGIAIYQREKKREKVKVRLPKSVMTIEDEEIRSHPENYIIHINYPDFQKIIDFSPSPGSIYLQSISEPFDEEGEIEAKKIDNWCKHFGLIQHRIHSSGHMSGPDFRWMVEEINPKIVLPIHSTFENSLLMKRMFPKKVRILNQEETFEIEKKRVVRDKSLDRLKEKPVKKRKKNLLDFL